jgi:hypothetical protein
MFNINAIILCFINLRGAWRMCIGLCMVHGLEEASGDGLLAAWGWKSKRSLYFPEFPSPSWRQQRGLDSKTRP